MTCNVGDDPLISGMSQMKGSGNVSDDLGCQERLTALNLDVTEGSNLATNNERPSKLGPRSYYARAYHKLWLEPSITEDWKSA